MTGYGEADIRLGDVSGKVVCRSVNHKNLEVRSNVPRDLVPIESKIVALAKTFAARGRIEVRVDLDNNASNAIVSESVFSETAKRLKNLANSGEVEAPTFRDVWLVASQAVVEKEEVDFETDLKPQIETALKKWDAARLNEGANLLPELKTLLSTISENLAVVMARQKDVPDQTRDKIEARLADAVQKYGLDDIDETRMAQELVLYVERGDIAEEIQRAKSHVNELSLLLDVAGAIGKKLDFYLQELFRECNTMGSKTSDLTITKSVIDMKSCVEKLREQAANIE